MMRTSAALVLIVGAGLVHGAWTDRWGPSAALAALAARFEAVPLVVGDWKGTPFELSKEDRAMAGASAAIARVYVNDRRGVSVSVILLGGPPGKIATHTPDVCFGGEGYMAHSSSSFSRRHGPENKTAEFRTILATREGTKPSVLRIFWAWNASKGWSAPEEPRWKFAAEPVLCKLYVVRETAGMECDPGADPGNDFLTEFLPLLDTLVFAPEGDAR